MQTIKNITERIGSFINGLGLKLRAKLIGIFVVVKVIPLVLLTALALQQFGELGRLLRTIAVEDSTAALNASAVENIERMTTDTARRVADFLYERDDDIRYLASLAPSEEVYRAFIEAKRSSLVRQGEWVLSEDGSKWVSTAEAAPPSARSVSSNKENEDEDGFSYRPPDDFEYVDAPLYDEITFVDLDGNELVKVVAEDSTKARYPMNPQLRDVSQRENTYVKAESYFASLDGLGAGDIYVSDVIGAYVGSNYIGMYAPAVVEKVAADRGYDIPFLPEEQAYSGAENPVGQRFEGIVRWATPVAGEDGAVIGYVTFALNHDHIMEFVDHETPMNERYVELPSAFEGNYAFIWDYQCRNISHPRHHSIAGYNPQTGEPEVPWLETSIYEGWLESGEDSWVDYVSENVAPFDNQSRTKAPAPALTRAGLVGLDGRYLNNAPQCTGWMDLSADGGSGSFYILWSGLYKLTTAGAIPYYTGQYAPSEANGYSKRGFGIITIGAGLEDFTQPATETAAKLDVAISGKISETTTQLIVSAALLVSMVVMVAVWLASYLSGSINTLIEGISRFRYGERQYRFHSTETDEFGTLAHSFDDMADSIVSSVNSPLCITDIYLNVKYMNDYGLRVNGKTLEDVIDRPYGENSIYPTNSEFCPIKALNEGREAMVWHSGDGHYYKGVANYINDGSGKRIGYIIVTTDVTEIQDARERAEQASRAKSEFLSNMSHEIRTPMNAIIGMTSIGKAAADPERKDYALGRIGDASEHLLGIINDILDMSKIEASKFQLSFTDMGFEQTVKRAVGVVGYRIEEKRQHFYVDIDPRIPAVLMGDEQRLAQVITNLLSNANKFTPEEGRIDLAAELLGEEEGVCEIKVTVTDTGIGISADQIPRLFLSFEQAESSTSRKYGGTGLGLVISKNIVEMMGGRIWIESEPGVGSAFAFTIRAERVHGAQEAIPKGLAGARAFIAADDALMGERLSAILERAGMTCRMAVGGETLPPEGESYDVCFADGRVSGDSGALVRSLKALDGAPRVVMMVFASEWNALELAVKDAGVDGFVTMPLFSSDVYTCLMACMEGRDSGEDSQAPDERDCFEGRRVLLAEDMEINREIVLALLEDTSLEIDCAENGVEAVAMFSKNPDLYDMIFMDLQMPEMDGLEATRRIRAMDMGRSADIPIVAMTANVFKEDVEKCLEAGMNRHIGKPLDLDEVLGILRRYL